MCLVASLSPTPRDPEGKNSWSAGPAHDSPLGMLIRRPAILPAAHKDAVGRLRGWFGVCRPPMDRTLAPPEEAKVPGVSSTGDRLSNSPGGGLYRQMEVITMVVAAILLGLGAVVLVFLGLAFLVGLAWFIASSF